MKNISMIWQYKNTLQLLKYDLDKLVGGLEYLHGIHTDLVKVSLLSLAMQERIGLESIVKEKHQVQDVFARLGFKDLDLFRFDVSSSNDNVLVCSGQRPILSLDFYSSCYQSDQVESACELIKQRFNFTNRYRTSGYRKSFGFDAVFNAHCSSIT